MKNGEVEEINAEIEQIIKQIRKGYSRNTICSNFKSKIMSPFRLFELAKCRIYAKKKFGNFANTLFFDEEGLRFATPPVTAQYRAKRLGNGTVADISCGVGIQLIYFGRNTHSSIGVEINPFRAYLAQLNSKASNINNIEIHIGDGLSKIITDKIDADIIFSDPSRLPEEPIRHFETLSPNPLEVYKRYKNIAENIVFELPPQIKSENIILAGEKEYTSLSFTLNRLALYVGPIATCETSAISLPLGERITDVDEKQAINTSQIPQRYLYEVDTTITRANLLENLMGKIGFDGHRLSSDNRRTILTSLNEYNSAFLHRYITRGTCMFSPTEINQLLKKLDAKKGVLRLSIPPDDYWQLRRKIEENLIGSNTLYIFKINGNAIIAEADF